MAQYELNLRDYLRILRRRKGIVFIVPILFGVFSFVLAVLQAPTPLYRAKAVVRVQQAISFAGLLQELVAFHPVGNLETQAALIKGFPVMSVTARKLGLIPREVTPEQLLGSPASLEAIKDLQEAIEVQRVEETSLIEIRATAPDPEEVVRIANTVAEAFQDDNFATRGRQVREAREFIERQLQEVGAKLGQSEDEVKSFKERNQLFILPEGTREVVTQLGGLEVDSERIRRAIEEVEAQFALLDDERVRARPAALSPEATDPVLSKLYASLSDLALERENLLLTLLPAHPQVKQLDTQIGNVRQSLRQVLTARLTVLRGRAGELRRGIARLRQEQAVIPEAALDMARMERDVKVNERLFSLLKEKHQEALIREKEQVPEVSVVRPATGPLTPINPPRALPKAAVGLVVGLVVGIVLAFVAEALDTSIGAIDEVEGTLGTPVLGVIPHVDIRAEIYQQKGEAATLDKETERKHAFLISLLLPKSRIVEAYLALRTNLLFAGLERDLKTVMVTSSTQREGKTTVAINLAIVLAQLGKRTLLVEADLRNPLLHHAFGISKEPGLTEVVLGSASLDDATRSFPDIILGEAGVEGLLGQPGLDNLFLIPSGYQPPNPTEFLSAQGMASFLAEVRQRYDYIILDVAPVLPLADPSILGARVDGTLIVVRVGRVARAALRRARALLDAAKSRVVGVCLTGVRAEVSPDYAEMAYYRYRYGPPETVAGGASGWLGWLGGIATGTARSRAFWLLLLLLLALALGVWTWGTGSLKLPLLSSLPLEAARVADSAASVPSMPGPRDVAFRPAAEVSHRPGPPDAAGAPGVSRKPAHAVQLHAFRSEEKARGVVARYRARGLPAFTAEARIPGAGRWWRVLVGKFETRDQAETFGWDLVLEGTAEEFIVADGASRP